MTQQIYTYKHVFWDSYNGCTGEDYTMYTNNNLYRPKSSNSDYIIMTPDRLMDIITKLKKNNSGATVPKGSSIYLSPNCPYAIDDVRHHYTLKRKPDTGDYNVFSIDYSKYTYLHLRKSRTFIIPDRKILVATDSYDNCVNAIIRNFIPDFDSNVTPASEVKIMPLYVYKSSAAILDYLLGRLRKSCVYYTALDVSNNNELTLDFLTILYNVGNKRIYESDKQNFLLELKVLNQYNWRDYLGTLRIMFRGLFHHRSIAACFMGRPSLFTKDVREILNSIRSRSLDFVSEKDFNMAKSFIDSLLHIGDLKYVSLENLYSKLESISLPNFVFNLLFDSIVKITPKAYGSKED